MPGPYNFPTDRVTGGPDPAADVNAIAAALNEADNAPTPSRLMLRDAAGRAKAVAPIAADDVATMGWTAGAIALGGIPYPGQYIPPVGDLFTSSYIYSASSVHLRGGSQSWMPLLLSEFIEFDQVSFRLNTVADAGTVGGIFLGELIGNDFVEIGSAIVAGIALDTATVGVNTFTLGAPIELESDRVYGFCLRQTTGSGFAVRIASGKIVGPGIEGAQGTSWDQLGLTPNFSTGLSQYIPIIKIRRSA